MEQSPIWHAFSYIAIVFCYAKQFFWICTKMSKCKVSLGVIMWCFGVFFPCINLTKYGRGEKIIKAAESITFHFIEQNPPKMHTLHAWNLTIAKRSPWPTNTSWQETKKKGITIVFYLHVLLASLTKLQIRFIKLLW